MASTLFGFQLASQVDPLANVKSIRAWLARLPRNDPVGCVEVIIRLLETGNASPPVANQNRLLAVMELDRVSMPLQTLVQTQYRLAAMSDEVRQRLWRASDELAHRFASVYEECCASMRVSGDKSPRARAELHGAFARLFHYVGVQTRQGLFRYEQWIPGKWRLLHSAYREAREQGVADAPFTLDELTPAADRLSPEQEYVQILLLHRVNTGNLTAQQIDWAAEWLRECAHLLRLAVAPAEGDGYWLDLTRGEGLVARRPQVPAGDLLYLDVAPLRAQLGTLITRGAGQAGANPGQGDRDEKLALARRLDQLWLPQAPEHTRRGERQTAQQRITVAAGWAEIAIALTAKVAQKAGAPQGYHYDDYGRLRPNNERERSPINPRKMAPDTWQMHDTSDSGFCIRSSSTQAARQRPGVLLALQLQDHPRWQIGVVRRIRRIGAEHTELGIEIISRNVALIQAKGHEVSETGYTVNGIDIGLRGKSFPALYLPPAPRAGGPARPTLLLPPAEFTVGRTLSLLIDGKHHNTCLAVALERTKDWIWTTMEIIE